ncbi:hypothetical protein EW145_g3517 [Phellinidium pouzarii]|uniref:ATPase inhibitor, mitochondrial n=1 Tax=Phellinidium pouzarii TaxID=167371 RepID=A0A4S4L8S2_9AGAM|nr:hypothetical protein EW145_g3517 [Phellinidium pouzarii]
MLATRISSLRRTPVLVARLARPYSDGRSKGFSRREEAEEGKHAKDKEREQLKKLRAQIDAKKAELEALEKEHSETAEKAK